MREEIPRKVKEADVKPWLKETKEFVNAVIKIIKHNSKKS